MAASRESQINAFLARARSDLIAIESEYEASLHAQAIADDLKIDIKRFCGDLRSVLDYLAHEIRNRYCRPAKSGARFYFPILPDRPTFEARMKRWFPDLDQANPDLWAYLESIQPYNSGPHASLGLLNQLNNENKHETLTEQTRIQTEQVRVTMPGGGGVSWTPGSVRFGSSVSIGGVPVDPATQMPVPHPSQKVERLIWVDFVYSLAGAEVSALQLLKQSLAQVTMIAGNVRPWL